MKLGMHMLRWATDVSGFEFGPVCEMLKDAGFEGVEIPIFDREVEKYAGLRTRLDGIGLEALAVSARADHDNPISADPAVRAEALVATKAHLASAAAPGAPLICGPLAAPLDARGGPGRLERDLRRDPRNRLRRLGRDRGVRRLAARARQRDEDLAADVREPRAGCA